MAQMRSGCEGSGWIGKAEAPNSSLDQFAHGVLGFR